MTTNPLRDPTEAMLAAARDWSDKKYGKPIGNDAAIGCWQAMLDAHPEQPSPTCRKCNGLMRPGIAIGQTCTSGAPDDLGGDEQTMSVGGPGQVIDCWKCAGCGWSVTQPAPTDALDRAIEAAIERALAETLPVPELSDACMSYRHDYRIMDAYEREAMRREAADWWRCLRRAIVDPSAAAIRARSDKGVA